MRTILAFVLIALAGGCASSGVAVKGKDLEVALMAGQWEGTYEGKESGRKGNIALTLAVGYRLAEGQVLMNSIGDPAQAKPLQIKFVEIGQGQLSGKIEPYMDPSCSCTVETEFIGQVAGNQITGTFTTRPAGGTQMQTGTWSATRKN